MWNPFLEKVFEHGTLFTVCNQFVLMSGAYMVALGGIGTVLDIAATAH